MRIAALSAACLMSGALFSIVGCTQPLDRQVNGVVTERTGHGLHPVPMETVDAVMHRLLGRELSAEGAVEIALLNNPGLKGRLEDLGIAQADLVQAGLMKNPVFAASWRFPDGGHQLMDAEYSITAEFLDLLVIPLRKQLAAQALARTESAITHDVLTLAADVKVAFYGVQAQQYAVERQQTLLEIEEAADALAEAQHEAGTLNDLSLAQRQASLAQARRELLKGRSELIVMREKVNRLLGLWGTDTVWRAQSAMPGVPAEELPLEHLESLALTQRMDFAAARQSVETLGRAIGVSEDFRYLASVKIGVDTERESHGDHLTGPTLELELPIFDNGEARLTVMRGRYQQSRQELTRLAVDIRSETREARDKLMLQRELVILQEQTLQPLRARIVELTQLHANAMVQGPYDLLAAKRDEVMAQRETADALRDYWMARAELERAVGGRLAPLPTAAAAPPPATAPASAEHQHDSHGDMP